MLLGRPPTTTTNHTNIIVLAMTSSEPHAQPVNITFMTEQERLEFYTVILMAGMLSNPQIFTWELLEKDTESLKEDIMVTSYELAEKLLSHCQHSENE